MVGITRERNSNPCRRPLVLCAGLAVTLLIAVGLLYEDNVQHQWLFLLNEANMALNEASDGLRGSSVDALPPRPAVKATPAPNIANLPLRDDILKQRIGADNVWDHLVSEGAAMIKQNKDPGVVLEVGMHRAKQCLQAAEAGLTAHCVEPSPGSFKTIQNRVNGVPPDALDRITLYNIAAGRTSQGTVPFVSEGSTGDHVGNFDAWNMEKKDPTNDTRNVIQVPAKRLDDLIAEAGIDRIFVAKIDTQGFEPAVFAGIEQSIQQNKAQFILTEFWPRGMDLLNDQPKDTCIAATVLDRLQAAGYTLYALPTMAHPKAPQGYGPGRYTAPLDNPAVYCRHFLDIEKQFPDPNYKFGYWADVLAVAPGVQLEAPVSQTGLALKG